MAFSCGDRICLAPLSCLFRGVGGSYKLCYQAPGGSDSVEQSPESGAIGLKVQQVTTTGEAQIEALSPSAVTSQVRSSFRALRRG